jgi:hypothetical protein
MLGISWVAAQLAASQEGLSSMSEWVSITAVSQRLLLPLRNNSNELSTAPNGRWTYNNEAGCATEYNSPLAVQMLSQGARCSADNLKQICCVIAESASNTDASKHVCCNIIISYRFISIMKKYVSYVNILDYLWKLCRVRFCSSAKIKNGWFY